MKEMLSIAIFLLYTLSVSGQDWTKFYKTGERSLSHKVVENLDGSITAIGASDYFDGAYHKTSLYTVDKSGNLLYSKHLGFPINSERTMSILDNGNYVFIVESSTLLLTDQMGNALWEIPINSSYNLSWVKSFEDRIYLLGQGDQRLPFLTVDLDGNILAEDVIPMPEGIGLTDFTRDEDGNFYFLGFLLDSQQLPLYQSLIISMDAMRSIVYHRTYTTVGYYEIPHKIVAAANDQFYMSYYTGLNNTPIDVKSAIRKLGRSGEIIWEKSYGKGVLALPKGPNFVSINDEEIAMVSNDSRDLNSGYDITYSRISSDGDLLEQRELGNQFNFVQNAIIQLRDGSFVINGRAGHYFNNYPNERNHLLIKFDSSDSLENCIQVDICEEKNYGPYTFHQDTVFETIVSNGSIDSLTKFSVSSYTTTDTASITISRGEVYNGQAYFQDTLLMEESENALGCGLQLITQITIDTTTSLQVLPSSQYLTLFPNPTESILHLKTDPALIASFQIRILNANGQVMDAFRNASTYNATQRINVGHYPPGLYFVQLINEDQQIVEKFIKQ